MSMIDLRQPPTRTRRRCSGRALARQPGARGCVPRCRDAQARASGSGWSPPSPCSAWSGRSFVRDPHAISDIGLSGPSGDHWLGHHPDRAGRLRPARLRHPRLAADRPARRRHRHGRRPSSSASSAATSAASSTRRSRCSPTSCWSSPACRWSIVDLARTSPPSSAARGSSPSCSPSPAGPRSPACCARRRCRLRNRDYVAAARVAGEKTWRVISVEILPNLLPVLASQFVFAVIVAILSEAGLSFLGLGASDSSPGARCCTSPRTASRCGSAPGGGSCRPG